MVIKFFLLSALMFLGACAPGIIYTDITRPLCDDMRATPLGERVGRGGSYKVEIPTTRIDLTAEWSSRAIGDIAKNHGIETVYSCDKRLVSFLAGIYRKEEVIIYGK